MDPRERSRRYVQSTRDDPEIERELAEARRVLAEHGNLPDALTRDEFRARFPLPAHLRRKK